MAALKVALLWMVALLNVWACQLHITRHCRPS